MYFQPKYNISLNYYNNYVITIELPGILKQNINISLQGNRLTIHALKEYNNQNIIFNTIEYGNFMLNLDNVEATYQDITASFTNGILTISYPSYINDLYSQKITHIPIHKIKLS